MKPSRDAAALAASLSSAAAKPLQAPFVASVSPIAAAVAAEYPPEPGAELEDAQWARQVPRPRKFKELVDTIQITLRPERELVEAYVYEAAERSKREGRMISMQQIMLEVLAAGPKVKS